jgi:hypothetical protein
MKEITKDGRALARHITAEDLAGGLSFFSKDQDPIQLGAWNYGAGVELKRHIHNEVARTILRTQEVLVVLNGSVEAVIYDLDGTEVAKLIVKSGEVLVLLDSGHGYRILEDGTRVIEVKNGPYLGAEIDRRRF